ncbi:MAG TPA: hypothetical protein VM912_02905 [Terriglobales bacterium]|nr:hypothetical protein [Terriglobales bacterium]
MRRVLFAQQRRSSDVLHSFSRDHHTRTLLPSQPAALSWLRTITLFARDQPGPGARGVAGKDKEKTGT